MSGFISLNGYCKCDIIPVLTSHCSAEVYIDSLCHANECRLLRKERDDIKAEIIVLRQDLARVRPTNIKEKPR